MQPGTLEITGSRLAMTWLAENQVSLAFTTYLSGRLFLFGRNDQGQLAISEWVENRCLGFWTDTQTVWVTTRFHIWRMENALPAGVVEPDGDRLFVPRVCYQTGDLDAHDIAVDGSGRVIFVNTLFSCLATLSDKHSFCPVWKPPFISRLAAEDRCHLNGLAMEEGRPAYVTYCAAADLVDGWRAHQQTGGGIIDVRTNEVVASGLSMPHSPRIHRGRLWVHDSGNGQFGYVDRAAGKFEAVAFLPGYLRGMCFVGKYVVVGLSQLRDSASVANLPITKKLEASGTPAKCGLFVIDLDSGDIVHWLQLGGLVHELYDVATLPGVMRPRVFDHGTLERNVFSIGPTLAI